MRFGSNRAVAALALVFGVLGSSNLGAVRPGPVAEDAGLVTPVWMPLGVSKAPVTVVVQLAGDSVAEQQGYAGRKLERGEKDRIKGSLRSQQDGLRGSIESLGGTVVANYQAAYNGIKVRIAHDRVKELAALPGVVAVRPLQLMKPDNVRGIPLIGTPAVWQSLGLHGEGVKIAIIDTGIDYTHANFGGPGTAAAYTAAHAKETEKANPALFGPSAPRIKGGFDFVGDSYNPDPRNPLTYQPIPHPDPNPLERRAVRGGVDQRRQGRGHRRCLGRQQRPEPVRHRLAGKRRRRHLGGGERPLAGFTRREHHRRDSYGPGDRRQRLSVIRDYELHDQGSYRRQRARLQRRRLRRSELPAVGHHRRSEPRHLRASREGDLRSEGRCGRSGDGEQRDQLPAVRGTDYLEPGHRRSFQRDDSVSRR